MKIKSAKELTILGANLAMIRGKWGGTQEEFGKRFFATRAMQSSYETGSAEPKLKYLLLLQETTGIEIYRLCTEKIGVEELPSKPYPPGTKHEKLIFPTTTGKEDPTSEIERLGMVIEQIERRVSELEKKT